MKKRFQTAVVLNLLAVVAVCSLLCFHSSAEAGQKKFNFALNLPPSLIGEGSASIIDYYNRLKKIIKMSSETGLQWVYIFSNRMPSVEGEHVVQAMLRSKKFLSVERNLKTTGEIPANRIKTACLQSV